MVFQEGVAEGRNLSHDNPELALSKHPFLLNVQHHTLEHEDGTERLRPSAKSLVLYRFESRNDARTILSRQIHY